MLLQARKDLLAEKLKEFPSEELAVIRSVSLRNCRRSELWEEFRSLGVVDSATNRAVKLGILNNYAYTFSPAPEWRDYLEGSLLHAESEAAKEMVS